MVITNIIAIVALIVSIISTIISIRTKNENILLKAAEKKSKLIISLDHIINRTEINLVKLKDLYSRILYDNSFAEKIKKNHGEGWAKILHEKYLQFEDLIAKREDILKKFISSRNKIMDDTNVTAIKAENAIPNLESIKMSAKKTEDTTTELEIEIENYIEDENDEKKKSLNSNYN